MLNCNQLFKLRTRLFANQVYQVSNLQQTKDFTTRCDLFMKFWIPKIWTLFFKKL